MLGILRRRKRRVNRERRPSGGEGCGAGQDDGHVLEDVAGQGDVDDQAGKRERRDGEPDRPCGAPPRDAVRDGHGADGEACQRCQSRGESLDRDDDREDDDRGAQAERRHRRQPAPVHRIIPA